MSSFRRWYFYVVAAFSLQAVTWAVIALLRNLLTPALRTSEPLAVERLALQIAVILIGLPMYLLHWRWASRGESEGSAPDDESIERVIYFYFMLALFLIPLLTNATGFLQALLRQLTGTPPLKLLYQESLPDQLVLVHTGAAVLVLAIMIFYHGRLLQADRRRQETAGIASELHRLFIYVFSAAGLAMTATAAANVLGGLVQTSGGRATLGSTRELIEFTALLLTGLVTWLIFWRGAQRLYRQGGTAEKQAVIRKVYLYVVIFIAVLNTVGAATALLSALFMRLLDVPVQAGSGIVAGTLLVGAAVWTYHALVLREDTRDIPFLELQAGVRRLYWYLVAAVALLAFLIGLGGVLGVLLDTSAYVTGQREQLAWNAATLIAGLAVWVIPWRNIQRETVEPAPAGVSARISLVRRFYLYFFVLLATLTFLLAAVFILSRLLTVLLGEPLDPEDGRDLALAAAYALMAAAVWVYHGWLLREDNRALEALHDEREALLQVLVVDDGDGRFGLRLKEQLQTAMPHLRVDGVGLTASAAGTLQAEIDGADQAIAAADIIIGPWSMAAPHAGLTADESLQAAIAGSAARKVILPRPAAGWEWAGVKSWNEEAAVRDATELIEDLIAGDGALIQHLNSPAMIALLIAATVVAIILITSLMDSVLPLLG